jgi:signal transduction histidine kinase
MPCHIASSVTDLCERIRVGAGCAILAEEALRDDAIHQILQVLSEQPPWSDLPLILFTIKGRVTAESERLRQLRRPLGNVNLLERPIRPETLLGAIEIALRGRQRQYQIRDQMAQYARAQEALRRSEKLAVTGRLAASIAHEINNPLEAVTNLLYLMRCDPTPEQMLAYLNDAEHELARVTEITKQTLRFYREPSQPVETDLAAVVQSVLVLYNSRLVSANITVRREILSPSVTVLSSPGELRQIVANLIGNAIDAMRLGGTLRIRVSVERGHQADRPPLIRLTIADTGSGIPPEIRSSIFEPFITTKGETGTGLGLWVTAEMLKKNGWSIRVHSSCGAERSGTVFSILIPLAGETANANLSNAAQQALNHRDKPHLVRSSTA